MSYRPKILYFRRHLTSLRLLISDSNFEIQLKYYEVNPHRLVQSSSSVKVLVTESSTGTVPSTLKEVQLTRATS